MFLRWLSTIIILPFNALLVIPALILFLTGYSFYKSAPLHLFIGIILLTAGLLLALWTMFLFHFKGKGTAAPWDPPKNFVVSGPYCYVRNPMILSVCVIIFAQYLLLNSIYLLIWCLFFWLANNLYFIFFEEKQLEKRFGQKYLLYKANVPRWRIRLTKWSLPE